MEAVVNSRRRDVDGVFREAVGVDEAVEDGVLELMGVEEELELMGVLELLGSSDVDGVVERLPRGFDFGEEFLSLRARNSEDSIWTLAFSLSTSFPEGDFG